MALLAALPGAAAAAEQTFDEAVAAYERGDYATAMRGFRVYAVQGHAEAQFKLGVMYAQGEGVPKNAAEAVWWWRKAAAQGDADAQYSLGAMYANADGVPQDYRAVLKWYRLAAEQGHDGAQHDLGLLYIYGKVVSTPLGPCTSKAKTFPETTKRL